MPRRRAGARATAARRGKDQERLKTKGSIGRANYEGLAGRQKMATRHIGRPSGWDEPPQQHPFTPQPPSSHRKSSSTFPPSIRSIRRAEMTDLGDTGIWCLELFADAAH
jgi:hypothetical protein